VSGEKAPLAHDAAPPLPARGGVLPEHIGKGFLKGLGIPVPAGAVAADLAAAKAIATDIGYPIVLKAQAASLAHKSDAGGVILGIDGESALTRAWRRMQDNMARAGIEPKRFLVEAMATGGLEMIVGARRDPDWGPVLMIGLGGIFVETLGDVRLMPADLPKAGVLAEIARLQCAPLLHGARGKPAVDIDALANAVVRCRRRDAGVALDHRDRHQPAARARGRPRRGGARRADRHQVLNSVGSVRPPKPMDGGRATTSLPRLRGRDRERAYTTSLAACPLPTPLPQAGEGAHRTRSTVFEPNNRSYR